MTTADENDHIDDMPDNDPPMARTVKIERDKKEKDLAFVTIEITTPETTTNFDIAVDANATGTMADAEQAAYRKLVKHLEGAKELAQSQILRP
jgi:hypothetical protein